MIFGIKGRNFFAMSEEVMSVLKFLVPEINNNYIGDLLIIHRRKERSPVVVTLNSISINIMILRRKGKLRGEQRFKNVQVKEDFTKEIKEIRKLLFPHLIRLKEEGKKVIMVGSKLKVNDLVIYV